MIIFFARCSRMPFPDPAALTGTDEEKLARIGEIRDAIRARVEAWASELQN